MATNTSGGTTTSFQNTPQAQDDLLLASTTGLTEDSTSVVYLDVMGNDLGGKAKILWSLDDGTNDSGLMGGYEAADLLAQDIGGVADTTPDSSANGAHVWISNGKVAYDPSTLDAAFKAQLQALAVGETLTDSFIYAIRLSNGTLSWGEAEVEFLGANDGPVISVKTDDSAAKNLDETDAALSATGTLTVNDPDTSDTVTAAVDSATLGGVSGDLTEADVLTMFSITPGPVAADAGDVNNLTWSFDSTPEAFDFLADGEELTIEYVVKATDNHGSSDTQTVTITITGTNDGPDITGTDVSAARNETDTTLTATGTLNVVDADLSDDVTVTVDSVAVDGTSTFAGVNPLSNADMKAMMSVLPAVLDADPAAGSDFDWTFTSGASGDGAFNFLAVGETLVLKYTLKATDDSGVVLNDSDTQVVTITITGSNDAPVVTAAVLATVDEDDANPASVNLLANASDPDLSDDVDTASVSYSVTSGTWVPVVAYNVDNETGALTFNPNQFNALGVSESIELTFSYNVVDGNGGITPTTAVVTITGSNDAPVVTAAVLATVDEDDANPASVNLLANASDPDRTDDVDTASVSYSVTSGTWVPVVAYSVDNETGALTFNPNQFNALGASDTIELTFSYNVVDGNGGITPTTAVVTITGSADGLPALFTEGVDNKDFNAISAGSFDPTTYYNALGGADIVTLPDAATTPADYDATNAFLGGAGNDTITAGDLTDIIDGGADNDSISGGGGADTLTGGVGNDILVGGSGNDTYRFGLTDGTDTVNDSGGGQDTIEFQGGSALSSLNFERIGNDLVIDFNGQAITVVNQYAGAAVENVSFSAGTTFMGYNLGGLTFNVEGDLSGGGQADIVAATDAGLENLSGGNQGDLLFANDGNDTLTGDQLNDLLVGGGGNDILVGSAGQDWLVGGANADTFDFNAPAESTLALSDVITDFVAGTDKIDLSGIDAKTQSGNAGDQAFAFVALANPNTVANSITWSESGTNTILHIDHDGNTTPDMQIILNGVGLGLTSTDFVL